MLPGAPVSDENHEPGILNSHTAKTVLLVANWDWVIYNFRLPLARALRDSGFQVTMVTPPGDYVQTLVAEGFRWVPWHLSRRSLNVFREAVAVTRLAKIYTRESPSLIHHDTIKPSLYGSLAVRVLIAAGKLSPQTRVINCFMGIGYVFSQHTTARLLRAFVLPCMRAVFSSSSVFIVFSNDSDRDRFVRLRLTTEKQSAVLVSEFVNLEQFAPNRAAANPGQQPPKILMASRLLEDKGVYDFVEAARLLRKRHVTAEFWLAGAPDVGAPGAIAEESLRSWDTEGAIKWLGQRSDMPALLKQVDIAALPTRYNEGMPKFLVEAAAAGLPLVAADLPACRRVVRHGTNGFLHRPQDPRALADIVELLIRDVDLRRRMADASRQLAVREFGQDVNIERWLALYRALDG